MGSEMCIRDSSVHFSMLHEFVSLATDLPMGRMYQISNNYHEYVEIAQKHPPSSFADPYVRRVVHSHKLFVGHWSDFLDEVENWCNGMVVSGKEPFLRDIAQPMAVAWNTRKMGADLADQLEPLMKMPEKNDWRTAAIRWLCEWSMP